MSAVPQTGALKRKHLRDWPCSCLAAAEYYKRRADMQEITEGKQAVLSA